MPSTVNGGADLIRPSSVKSYWASVYSWLSWNALRASGECTDKLPYSCSQVRTLLHKTPSIPRVSDVPDIAEGGVLVIEGFSKWSICPNNRSANRECDLNATKESYPRRAYTGVSRPATCELSEKYVATWPGFESLPHSAGNYLCVCVLGWSYVFSARLVELRGMTPNDHVAFTNDMAQCAAFDEHCSPDLSALELGDIGSPEIRWWAAILAAGRGWQATLDRDGKTYFSPWECHLAKSSFRLHFSGQESSLSSLQDSRPPSSAEAQAYLLDFARSHDCFDQLLAAFLTTMTLPSQSRSGAPVVLPMPVRGDVVSSVQSTEAAFTDLLPTMNEIPHFMALSCISNAMTSSLAGCFFEPDVPCNLVSEWLNPPLKTILPSLAQQERYHDIVRTLAYRRSTSASLWLGSMISGLLPRVLQVCRSYLPPISLEAAVWTNSPQSFMDPMFHRRAKVYNDLRNNLMISREDELRLLFLTDTQSEVYCLPPLSPYPPFGHVKLEDTSIEVRLHAECDHRLRYDSWVWKGKGEMLSDRGLSFGLGSQPPSKPVYSVLRWTMIGLATFTIWSKSAKIHTSIPKLVGRSKWGFLSGAWVIVCLFGLPNNFRFPLSVVRGLFPWPGSRTPFDDRLSESATRDVFGWTFFPDGTKLEDRGLWDHEWLSFLLGRNDGDESHSTSGSSSARDCDHIQEWLHNSQTSSA